MEKAEVKEVQRKEHGVMRNGMFCTGLLQICGVPLVIPGSYGGMCPFSFSVGQFLAPDSPSGRVTTPYISGTQLFALFLLSRREQGLTCKGLNPFMFSGSDSAAVSSDLRGR